MGGLQTSASENALFFQIGADLIYWNRQGLEEDVERGENTAKVFDRAWYAQLPVIVEASK